MVNWTAHYNAIYGALGVSATLEIDTVEHSITVIDKTSGIEVDMGGDVTMNTIKPACAVRVPELTSEGIELSQLRGGHITFNSKRWRIENRIARPSPAGEMSGEIYCILTEADDDD